MPPLSTLNKTALTLAITQAVAMSSANAETITVNDFEDGNGNTCTLRQAIMSANNDASPGSSNCVNGNGDDTISIQNAETATISLSTGALAISSNMSIDGGGVTVNAAPNSRILDINNINGGPTVSIDNMTLTGANATNSFGAGLIINRGSDVTITNSTITENTTNLLGGGVAVLGNSTLTIVDSTISNNTVTINENPINGYYANRGGGIYVQPGSTLAIERSTLSGNDSSEAGGGIYNAGSASITNSTVSDNSSGLGGGIMNLFNANITITNSTLSGNRADTFGGGIFNFSEATITNSIISGNRGGSVNGKEISNSNDISLSNNVIGFDEYSTESALRGVTVIGANNVLATEDEGNVPLNQIIASLNDNGGPTQTHALVFGSPALNAANASFCAELDTDQRGENRDDCDIGAFEAQANEAQREEACFVVPTANGGVVNFCL